MLSETDLVAPGTVLAAGYRRETAGGVLVVESVGSAVVYAAASQVIYEQLDGHGTEILLR